MIPWTDDQEEPELQRECLQAGWIICAAVILGYGALVVLAVAAGFRL